MASITSGISSLLQSVLDVVSGLFNVIFGAFHNVFDLAQNLIGSIFDLMSGFVGFALGNIVIIGVLVAAFVGYSAYRQKNQGGGITAGKKRS